ncbi:cornifelin homolog [Heterodontus francisci]|uniref:cornifelin homolog n=1 Tax=Heterodontus francisci TaxID=7792 RepID=UPI00355AD838
MTSTTVIIQQPGVVLNAGTGRWSTGLCSCFDDMPICCCGLLCPMFMGCYVASNYGENCCVGMLPGGIVALRTHMRLSYGIQGSICEDLVMTCCCGIFEICRMAREMRKHTQ